MEAVKRDHRTAIRFLRPQKIQHLSPSAYFTDRSRQASCTLISNSSTFRASTPPRKERHGAGRSTLHFLHGEPSQKSLL